MRKVLPETFHEAFINTAFDKAFDKAFLSVLILAVGAVGQPITGLPRVDARSQGGLLDVALSPDFASAGTIS
jgi:glucose/arabinose dehydrogenase